MNYNVQCNVGARGQGGEGPSLHQIFAKEGSPMQCNSMQAKQGRYMVRGQGVEGLSVAAKKVWKPIA